MIQISNNRFSGATSLQEKVPVSLSEQQTLAAMMMTDSQLTIDTTRESNYTPGEWCVL